MTIAVAVAIHRNVAGQSSMVFLVPAWTGPVVVAVTPMMARVTLFLVVWFSLAGR